MPQTASRARTSTREAVRYVANRILGDLLAIHEKFRVPSESLLRSLAHDVSVGLYYDCLESLHLFLYRDGSPVPRRAYVYRRVAPSSFEHSPHSGRIASDPSLVDGRLDFEVQLRDSAVWDDLQKEGSFRIAWGPCIGQSTAGMYVRADGGYASGSVGLSRTCLGT